MQIDATFLAVIGATALNCALIGVAFGKVLGRLTSLEKAVLNGITAKQDDLSDALAKLDKKVVRLESRCARSRKDCEEEEEEAATG